MGLSTKKDIRFVEKNFLKKGPDASKSQTPVEKSKKRYTDRYFKEIGINA